MNRIIKFKRLCSVPIFKFSLANVEEELKQFQEYNQALLQHKQGRFQTAEELYSRVLQVLEQAQQKQSEQYLHALKQATKASIEGNLKMQSHRNLLSLYTFFRNNSDRNNKIKQLQQAFNNLIVFYLRFDLDKAKDILQDGRELNINDNLFNNNIYFLMAQQLIKCLDLLSGNAKKSIETLKQVSQKKDIQEIEWMIYSNLGIAIWANQYPEFNRMALNPDANQREGLSEDTNILEAARYFKKSLQLLHPTNQFPDFKEIIESEGITPDKNAQKYNFYFQAPGTQYPLLGISDYLIDAQPKKLREQTFWLRFALKFHEMYLRQEIYKPITSLAYYSFFQKQYIKSEGLFTTATHLLQNNSTIQKAISQYYFGLQIGKIEKRQGESERLMSSALEHYNTFPKWHHWLQYLALPKITIE